MKILHISDLHFVSEETNSLVKELNKGLDGSGLALPELRLDSEDRKSVLQFFCRSDGQPNSYDGIIFTGDATTFGDDTSMGEAGEFLRAIAERILRPECQNNIVAIPGNHDVLEYGLRVLCADVSKYLGPFGNLLLRVANAESTKIRDALNRWLQGLDAAGATPMNSRQIDSFRDFIGYRFNSHFAYCHLISTKDDVRPLKIVGKSRVGSDVELNIFPINTLPHAPALFNMGVVSQQMRENIQLAKPLTQPRREDVDVLNFALTHHGFMPLSQEPVLRNAGTKTNLLAVVEHSLSSQLNGYMLGSTLQDFGFDCHFHGHEHRSTSIQFDFDLDTRGSIYSVGAGSVAAAPGQTPSFNILEFPDAFCMNVTCMKYNMQTARFEGKQTSHVFDKKRREHTTRLARDEITRFFLKDADRFAESIDPVIDGTSFAHECDSLLFETEGGIFVFGVRLQKLRGRLQTIARDGVERQKDRLRRRLVGAGFDFLVVAPMPPGTSSYDKDIPGSEPDLVREWGECFREIAAFLRLDYQSLKGRVRIRTTHVPIAHAGHIEFQARPPSQPRFIRGLIQVIKVNRNYDTEVFLELSYRTNAGLLKYYAGSAWNLWDKAAVDLDIWSETVAS